MNNKSNSFILVFLVSIVVLFMFLSGCITSTSDNRNKVVVDGIDQEISIQSQSENITLIVDGINNVVKVPKNVRSIRLFVDGIRNIVYVCESTTIVAQNIDGIECRVIKVSC